ncbi:hypothetical protein Vadar_004213 [Vaccinium darrowii]|uniref:Uncharacterized protein n=1 Tax=Vaccinium darrowii TaxID=229202 RepID=A0ACB7WXT2_9ERIC|nr:hypothetical protein Vadar_004213 [Vaccinium darrowii]
MTATTTTVDDLRHCRHLCRLPTSGGYHQRIRNRRNHHHHYKVHGNPMDVLSQKLRKLKSLLKDFNKEFYSDIHKRVVLAHDELSILQTQRLALPYDVTLHESEKDALLKYTDLVAAEEDFNRQKSRVKWLALGDQNSKFFHKKVKSHVVRSKILSICDENGIRLDEPVAVKAEILGFYKKLLGEKRFVPSVWS